MIIAFLILILIIHGLVFLITSSFINPDLSKKNKTPYQIEEAKRYNEAINRNYPYCSKFITFLQVISILYFFFYSLLSNINVIYSAIGTNTVVYLACLTAITLFFLMSKANNEYDNSEFSFRKEHPNFRFLLVVCMYTASVVFSFLTIHFTNYALDFSKAEEHIVVVTKSVHRTTRGSKGGTNHHYEIYFTPSVKDINMIDVSRYQQSITHVNDRLKLYVKNGVFGIPYISSKMEIVK